VTLKKITWQDPSGKQRIWESAERKTRPSSSEADAVGVVAILNDPSSSDGPSLLLQKQFRPPLNKITIESPSGLIDQGETPAETAIRELREETGYFGTIPKTSGETSAEGFIMHNDPGSTNTNTKMVFVDVDMSDERNRAPKPELEEGEFIETFTIPLSKLWTELGRMDKEGYAIDARVGGIAQGLEIARLYRDALSGEQRSKGKI
jgi:ADP-ribose pyrophosphatase